MHFVFSFGTFDTILNSLGEHRSSSPPMCAAHAATRCKTYGIIFPWLVLRPELSLAQLQSRPYLAGLL